MNQIVNDYGALRRDTSAANAVEACMAEYERKMRDIICFYKLTPVEIRCVASYTPSVFAEEILVGATYKRNAEKGGVCAGCGKPITLGPDGRSMWFNCNC